MVLGTLACAALSLNAPVFPLPELFAQFALENLPGAPFIFDEGEGLHPSLTLRPEFPRLPSVVGTGEGPG